MIALIGRDAETVERSVATLGDDCLGFSGDVSPRESLNEFYVRVKARFGTTSCLPMPVFQGACPLRKYWSHSSIRS
jgi:hypothetical protein